MNEIEPFSDAAATDEPFDNVAVRTRGERCLAASVAPPFQAVYWPEVGEAARVSEPQPRWPASGAAPLGDKKVQGIVALA